MSRSPEWPLYKRLGVPETLRSAARIIADRGLAKGTSFHRGTGRVDTFGALALAVGVPEGSLSGDLIEMASAAPARRQVLLPICVELIESWTEEDLSAWNDRQETTAGSVASSLMRLAGLIEAVL